MPRSSWICLLAVLLVAGCAAPTGSTTPQDQPSGSAPPSRPAPVCPADGISMRAGEIDAALGLRAMGVDLVNCGTRTITLNGYPGVRLSGADGRPIKFSLKHGVRAVAMIEEWERPPQKVTLRPGESAVSLLVWRNITEATPEGPATATGLEMAVADGRPPYQRVPMPNTIDLGTTAKLAVSPWRRNESGDGPVPTTDPSIPPLV